MRLRSRAFPASVLGGLTLLSAWWLPAGTAQAASYPPALGCAVTGTAGSGGMQVQGIGFRAGSPVRISAGGKGIRAVADPTGSFEAWLPATGTALTAMGPGCTAHGVVSQNPPSQPDKTPPSSRPGNQPGPVRSNEPPAVAIPVAQLTHVPSQLFLGLAGAVLLTGAALTGLTGRWGHRAEGRPSSGTPVSSTVPVNPDNA